MFMLLLQHFTLKGEGLGLITVESLNQSSSLIDWLIGWFIGWLVDWLIDWLIGWFIG